MKKNQIINITAFTAVIAFIAIFSQEAIASNEGNKRPGGPPPAAIKACKDKEVGEAVTFTGRGGEQLQATCKEIEGQVAAVPDNRPPSSSRN